MHILTLCKRKFWMATSYRKRNLEITNVRFQYKADIRFDCFERLLSSVSRYSHGYTDHLPNTHTYE